MDIYISGLFPITGKIDVTLVITTQWDVPFTGVISFPCGKTFADLALLRDKDGIIARNRDLEYKDKKV